GEYRRNGVFAQGSRGGMRLPAAAKATGLIKVTVNTIDQVKNPVQTCEVKYVTVIKKNNSAFYQSFAQFSTTTSESLVVGNYEMWTEKGGTAGPKRTIAVTSASTSQTVDLIAP